MMENTYERIMTMVRLDRLGGASSRLYGASLGLYGAAPGLDGASW